MIDLELKQLGIEIEQLREMLYCVVVKEGIRSSIAIQTSQALDHKISEYYRLKG